MCVYDLRRHGSADDRLDGKIQACYVIGCFMSKIRTFDTRRLYTHKQIHIQIHTYIFIYICIYITNGVLPTTA